MDLQRRLAASLGAVLVLALAVWVHWRNTVQVDETAEWVTHTREMLGEIEMVLRLRDAR